LSSSYIDADRGSLERLDRGELESYTAKLKSDRDMIALRVSLMDISATEIRRMVREGKSIKYLLPEAIESYIITNRLYRRNE
jgi:nicotinate-nucleotide adenylyltransferase